MHMRLTAFVLLEHKTCTCMITFQRILGMHESLKEGDSLTQAANSSFNKACLHLLILFQLELMRHRQGDHHCSFFQWLSTFCVYDKASISLGVQTHLDVCLCSFTIRVILHACSTWAHALFAYDLHVNSLDELLLHQTNEMISDHVRLSFETWVSHH